jgi:hypothetical protein
MNEGYEVFVPANVCKESLMLTVSNFGDDLSEQNHILSIFFLKFGVTNLIFITCPTISNICNDRYLTTCKLMIYKSVRLLPIVILFSLQYRVCLGEGINFVCNFFVLVNRFYSLIHRASFQQDDKDRAQVNCN